MVLSGNLTDSATLSPGCGVLQTDAEAGTGTFLSLRASSKEMAALEIDVDLGSSPSPGELSPESVGTWSATGATTASSNCAYTAGSEAVPSGTFALNLSAVEPAGGPGGAGVAHGTIDLTLYVHAPATTDCGLGDTENVTIDF